MFWVAISLLSIFELLSAARMLAELFEVAASASLLVAAILVAVAEIRTASGVTWTVPYALTVMYRLAAA